MVTSLFVVGNTIFWGDEHSMIIIVGILLGAVYLVYFIFCVSSYILILKRILQSRRNTQTNTGHESSNNNNGFMLCWREIKRRGYIIPLFITLTYSLFVVISVLITGFCGFLAGSCGSLTIWRITYSLNNISDVLIYVFCEKDIQNHLKNMLSRFRRSEQNNNNSNNIELNLVTPTTTE